MTILSRTSHSNNDAHLSPQALLPLCLWTNVGWLDSYSVSTFPATGALVHALLDILSWLLLAQHSLPRPSGVKEVDRECEAPASQVAQEVMTQVMHVLLELPNGALFVLHPPTRRGWEQVLSALPVELSCVCLYALYYVLRHCTAT